MVVSCCRSDEKRGCCCNSVHPSSLIPARSEVASEFLPSSESTAIIFLQTTTELLITVIFHFQNVWMLLFAMPPKTPVLCVVCTASRALEEFHVCTPPQPGAKFEGAVLGVSPRFETFSFSTSENGAQRNLAHC